MQRVAKKRDINQSSCSVCQHIIYSNLYGCVNPHCEYLQGISRELTGNLRYREKNLTGFPCWSRLHSPLSCCQNRVNLHILAIPCTMTAICKEGFPLWQYFPVLIKVYICCSHSTPTIRVNPCYSGSTFLQQGFPLTTTGIPTYYNRGFLLLLKQYFSSTGETSYQSRESLLWQ